MTVTFACGAFISEKFNERDSESKCTHIINKVALSTMGSRSRTSVDRVTRLRLIIVEIT